MTRRTFLLAVPAVFAAGCNQGTRLVPVTGKVMIDGKPLTHGKVQVAPAGSRPAIATIQPDGTFTFGTFGDSDGIAVGTHPAAVIAHETTGPGSQKWHAPKKYMSFDTSGLTVTIDKDTKEIQIDLTWAGSGYDKPFMDRFEKE